MTTIKGNRTKTLQTLKAVVREDIGLEDTKLDNMYAMNVVAKLQREYLSEGHEINDEFVSDWDAFLEFALCKYL